MAVSLSAPPPPAAVARELMAALEQYEAHVDQLACGWLDMDRYREVSAEIERIRGYSAALPQLSVPWTELLIAHAELVHCLWRTQALDAQERAPQLDLALRQHRTCIRALHECCRPLSGAPLS